MESQLIISVSGLRGVAGRSLTPSVAAAFAAAFAADLPAGKIVVSRDGRESGPMLVEAVTESLAGCGRQVLDAGVAATPTLGVLVRTQGAAGGVQISASHNPREYNGMKLFAAQGRVLPASEGARVVARFRAGVPARNTADLVEGVPLEDGTSAHLALLTAICDVDRIRRQSFRVLLDANHGAGSVLGRKLLRELGCDVTVLGGEPDGQFDHLPEPTAENLASVLDKVGRCGAAVGFCQDPDADRLAIIDENGRYLGEEKTLALCVDHVLASGRVGPIVTNCSTSRMSEDLARKYGAPFYRSQVGEANVVDMMMDNGAAFGGEGNGGVIDPRVGLVRDSFVAMALVLDALAARGERASALADALPRYEICKATVAAPSEGVAAGLDALEHHFSDAKPDRLDGLRLDWADGSWLLVRPSNTEPLVRSVAEARTQERARELCREAAAVLRTS
jgi:phosphomannomutase